MSKRIFSIDEVDAMCRRCGFSRDELHAVLRKVGPTALPPAQRARWAPDNPTIEFCYRVSEAIHRSGRTPEGFLPMRKAGKKGSHYFFQHRDTGEIVDPTADQFTPRSGVRDGYDYDGAKKASFIPPGSHGAQAVADELGWEYPARRRA